jgi:hypothetical protein
MAGLGKKTFVAGDVLTANDTNGFLMDQTVMNFANSAARSSAIPSPSEGMTTYVQDRNQIETFDGVEYRGMSGLQLVKKQTIGTGVTSVTVTNAFSATYDNYLIIINDGTYTSFSFGDSAPLVMTLGSTNTNYYRGGVSVDYTSSTVTGINTANGASWGSIGTAYAFGHDARVELFSPFLSKTTSMRSSTTGGNQGFLTQGGVLLNTTSYTSFTVAQFLGSMTGGTIYVYGYAR